jgi:hypothetical protein
MSQRVLAEFQAIGEDPGKFTFINAHKAFSRTNPPKFLNVCRRPRGPVVNNHPQRLIRIGKLSPAAIVGIASAESRAAQRRAKLATLRHVRNKYSREGSQTRGGDVLC